MATQRLCSIPNCGKPHRGHGFCSAHLERWQRHGDPLIRLKPANGEAADFYRSVVLAYESDECLLWPFALHWKGYGQMHRDGRQRRVHRLVCEDINGPPPTSSHQAAHNCGNRACCNPRHIRWATPAENQADRIEDGTSNRGERAGAAKLSRADVLEIRRLKGVATSKELAARFGISQPQISAIQNGKSWSWLNEG